MYNSVVTSGEVGGLLSPLLKFSETAPLDSSFNLDTMRRGMSEDNCEWEIDWDREEVTVVELHKGHTELLSLHHSANSPPIPPASLPLPSSNIPLHPVPLQFQSHPFVIVIC